MGARKAGSIHFFLGIEHALRKAGADDELLEAMLSDPDVAAVMVASGKYEAERKQNLREARARRKVLDISLKEGLVFTTRVRNLLLRRRVATLGQLCMMTMSDVEGMRGMGARSILEIMQVLAACGLDLRGEYKEPAEHALWLYGEAEYIPAPLMMLWATRLDGQTKDILTEYETLGNLVTLSGNEFMHEAYGYRQGELMRTPKEQLRRLVEGLRQVGLTLRSE